MAMADTHDTTNYIGLTAEIVSAYVSNNAVASADIPALSNQVLSALLRVSSGEAQSPSEPL
jgi:predicted transcriptional regulator